MVFGLFEKKKDENKDVKEAVSKKEAPTMKTTGIPEHVASIEYKEPMPTPEEVKEKLPENLHMAEPLPEKAKFAPLFVKVEKYREILESINRIKMILVNVQSLFNVQNEIKTLRAHVDEELQKELHQLQEVMAVLDNELVRPKAVEPYIMPKPSETAKMQGYVSELEGELSKLQDQLKKIE